MLKHYEYRLHMPRVQEKSKVGHLGYKKTLTSPQLSNFLSLVCSSYLRPSHFMVRAMKKVAFVLHPETRVTTARIATAVFVLPLNTVHVEVTLHMNLEQGPLRPRAVPQTS